MLSSLGRSYSCTIGSSTNVTPRFVGSLPLRVAEAGLGRGSGDEPMDVAAESVMRRMPLTAADGVKPAPARSACVGVDVMLLGLRSSLSADAHSCRGESKADVLADTTSFVAVEGLTLAELLRGEAINDEKQLGDWPEHSAENEDAIGWAQGA